jgi:hypothetical protein
MLLRHRHGRSFLSQHPTLLLHRSLLISHKARELGESFRYRITRDLDAGGMKIILTVTILQCHLPGSSILRRNSVEQISNATQIRSSSTFIGWV